MDYRVGCLRNDVVIKTLLRGVLKHAKKYSFAKRDSGVNRDLFFHSEFKVYRELVDLARHRFTINSLKEFAKLNSNSQFISDFTEVSSTIVK